ncbi:MAG: substrate-binding domain-containing protein [Rhodobacteraceae bacterium]|jgi:ribose transport system substrate-binding protein|nr:substrate-binding domain-containing protein [Paracoccaceae bacterium]
MKSNIGKFRISCLTMIGVLATTSAAWSADLGRTGTVDELLSIEQFCGTKPIRVALVDGFGGNSWRRTARAEFEDEASKCDTITETFYVDGQGNPQKTISDLQGLVAQGVEVIVVLPDAGPAMLPTIRQAFAAGISVVPYAASPGGEPGKDYVEFVASDAFHDGLTWGAWIAEQLDHKGRVAFLGGTPGNLQSKTEYEGIKEALSQYPEMEIIGDRALDTNWDPAETQKVVAGLLAQGEIDGIISDYGGGSVGGLRAFVAAQKPLVPWAAQDVNELACLWYENKAANPDFQLMTVSSRTWLVRLALRKAVAHAQGIENPEPSIIEMPIIEDSTVTGMEPKCEPSLPADAMLSSGLGIEKLAELFK